MFTDITTNNDYPKTLVIRNHEGGAIWQVYHMDNEYQVNDIVKGATSGGFEAITLEDYQADYEETFPYWRQDVMDSYVRKFPHYLQIRTGVAYPYKVSESTERY